MTTLFERQIPKAGTLMTLAREVQLPRVGSNMKYKFTRGDEFVYVGSKFISNQFCRLLEHAGTQYAMNDRDFEIGYTFRK